MTGAAGQGWSVALSGDGKTALLGGPYDKSSAGAIWVFTRTGTTWKQQGTKLAGTGAAGHGTQGYSVALSANGNTAVAGGLADNSSAGATWVFTRTGTVWKQQGQKLVGTGAVGKAYQGNSVGISNTGNRILIGGPQDKSGVGAAWIFARSGTVWKQQGAKLTGTGAKGSATQGRAVGLSGDGKTALLGGDRDNSNAGAAWSFFNSAP